MLIAAVLSGTWRWFGTGESGAASIAQRSEGSRPSGLGARNQGGSTWAKLVCIWETIRRMRAGRNTGSRMGLGRCDARRYNGVIFFADALLPCGQIGLCRFSMSTGIMLGSPCSRTYSRSMRQS